MGGRRPRMGHTIVGAPGNWVAAGGLVGLHHPWMGRVLGLGPGGERRIHALDCRYRLHPLHHGAEASRDVPYVEPGFADHRLWVRPVRDVHQPGRAGSVGSLLWRIHAGLDIPNVHGRHDAHFLRDILLAIQQPEECPDPGIGPVERRGFPGQ